MPCIDCLLGHEGIGRFPTQTFRGHLYNHEFSFITLTARPLSVLKEKLFE